MVIPPEVFLKVSETFDAPDSDRPHRLIPACPVEDQVRVRARAVGHHGRAEERDGVLLEQGLLGRRPRRGCRGRHPGDVVEGAAVAREPRGPRALLGAPVLELVAHSPPPAHLGFRSWTGVLCRPGGLRLEETGLILRRARVHVMVCPLLPENFEERKVAR